MTLLFDSISQYNPFDDRYAAWPGPSGNTFAQWVVGDKMRPGFRAVGKRFPDYVWH